jgi:dCTP deaminase
MSILTKTEILERIKKDEIGFSPKLDSFQLQPHSIDLRLGYTFLIYKRWQLTDDGRVAVSLDYEKSNKHFDVVELEEGQYFEILPHEYVIVSTLEKVKLPNDLMAVLHPRSSVNRRGLSVDLTGMIDAGYQGNLIIPLRNNTDSQVIRVYPGERFCQIVFHELTSEVKTRKSRYDKKDIVVGVLNESKGEEEKLIRKGKIKMLKEKYSIEK